MKSALKQVSTFNGLALSDFIPDIEDNFNILICMTIGPADREGGHDYSLNICTPRWIDHNIQNSGPTWGRHLLVVNKYAADEIRISIESIVVKCERPEWEATAQILSRFFYWEFEDY